MEKSTGRVEAFSDGVFAIAITLLILEIRVPKFDPISNRGLWSELLELWPSFLAFVMSFFVILIMWMNHHELLRLVRRASYPFLLANGLLLLMVTFVPFPTAVLAQYLGTPACNASAAFYCGTFVLISLAHNLLFATIARHRRLVRTDISDKSLQRIGRVLLSGHGCLCSLHGRVILVGIAGPGDVHFAVARLDHARLRRR